MTPPITVHRKPISPEESALLERMIRIHPVLQDGNRDLSDREALRLIDFVEDGVINACDLQDFNEGLPFSEAISPEDLRKAHRILAKHSPPVRRVKLGSFEPKESFCPSLPVKNFHHQGIEIHLKGHSTQIDETLLRSVAEAAHELAPFLITPPKQIQIFWAPGLSLPAGSPRRDELFSGVFRFGARPAAIATAFKLSFQMMKDLEERGMNWKLGRNPGDKTSAEFRERFGSLHQKAQGHWDLLAVFDPSRYSPEIPKDWGFEYFQKHQTFVDDRHLFAAVAVTARYFRKEFEERIKMISDGETRRLAQEIMGLVSSRVGTSP